MNIDSCGKVNKICFHCPVVIMASYMCLKHSTSELLLFSFGSAKGYIIILKTQNGERKLSDLSVGRLEFNTVSLTLPRAYTTFLS